jgi:hypothetical protein
MTRLLLGSISLHELFLLLSLFPLVGVLSVFGWSFRKRSSALPPTPPHPVPPPRVAIEERRQSPRRTVTPVFVQLRRTPDDDLKLEGLVLDVSQGGLGLSLKQEIPVGTVLEIRVTTASSSVPWTPVEVRYCLALSCRWKIGCRFVQEPPPQARVLFG